MNTGKYAMTIKAIITKLTAPRKPRYAMTRPAYAEFQKLMRYKNKWQARALEAEEELSRLRTALASHTPKRADITLH
jgi:hypothetical protein